MPKDERTQSTNSKAPRDHLSVDNYLQHKVLKPSNTVRSINDAKDPGFGVIPKIRADCKGLPFSCSVDIYIVC